MNNQANLPYDPQSAESIWQYSASLLGRTLRDFMPEGYEVQHGRGRLGNMVEELFFYIENNGRAEADFKSAGLELKCTPVVKKGNGALSMKERLVCNMIDYCEVVNEDFEHSHFYTKCQLMLILIYLYVKELPEIDLEFIISLLWKFPAKDLEIIRQDYLTIVNKIKEGEAHNLSEGDTLYLAACRKGQSGDSLRKQPFSDVGAPRRAFSLKRSYMETVLQSVLRTGKNHVNMTNPSLSGLVSTRALRKESFDGVILNRFKPFMGKAYQNIAKHWHLDLSSNPKNKFALIASAVASEGKYRNVNLTDEFVKSGMMMKTIRVQANGGIKESMAFENINYQEVFDNENWFESRLYEIFSSRFLFVVFREQTLGMEDYVLDRTFFWTMPQEDLKLAEEYWQNIRKNVEEDHVDACYFWSIKDNRKFHVRPKAQKAVDRDVNPLGEGHAPCKKFCYWFNNSYIKEIVRNNDYGTNDTSC